MSRAPTLQNALAALLININRHAPFYRSIEFDEDNGGQTLGVNANTFVNSLIGLALHVDSSERPPFQSREGTRKTVRWAAKTRVHRIPQKALDFDNTNIKGKSADAATREGKSTGINYPPGHLCERVHICESYPIGQCPDAAFMIIQPTICYPSPGHPRFAFPTLRAIKELVKHWAVRLLSDTAVVSPAALDVASVAFYLQLACNGIPRLKRMLNKLNDDTGPIQRLVSESRGMVESLEALVTMRNHYHWLQYQYGAHEQFYAAVIRIQLSRKALEKAVDTMEKSLKAVFRCARDMERLIIAAESSRIWATPSENGTCPSLLWTVLYVLAVEVEIACTGIHQDVGAKLPQLLRIAWALANRVDEVRHGGELEEILKIARYLEHLANGFREPYTKLSIDIAEAQKLGKIAEDHERLRLSGLGVDGR